jgi:hypothetical protein
MKYWANVVIISLVGLVSCQNPVRYPPEPYVEFVSYQILPATDTRPFPALEVEMYFRDGDGDIGLDPGDTLAPFCDTCDYFNNLFVSVLSKEDGEFSDSFEENSRIKNITPIGQNKTLEGTLQYRVNLNNRSSDTLMVEMTLIDRALNESNTEASPEIYVGDL